jgi:hypothetical protein
MVVITLMIGRAVAGGPMSDSLIGWTRFVRAHSWGPLAIIVTYHLGQAALVVSLV